MTKEFIWNQRYLILHTEAYQCQFWNLDSKRESFIPSRAHSWWKEKIHSIKIPLHSFYLIPELLYLLSIVWTGKGSFFFSRFLCPFKQMMRLPLTAAKYKSYFLYSLWTIRRKFSEWSKQRAWDLQASPF